MLRSLLAVLAATLIGLTTSKFVEGAGQTLLSAPPQIDSDMIATPAGYGVILVISWAAGAFAAALCALLIGRRWAPLGGLAASTVFLSAFIALLSSPLSWVLWPLSALATAGGGYGAIRLLRATAAYPEKNPKRVIF